MFKFLRKILFSEKDNTNFLLFATLALIFSVFLIYVVFQRVNTADQFFTDEKGNRYELITQADQAFVLVPNTNKIDIDSLNNSPKLKELSDSLGLPIYVIPSAELLRVNAEDESIEIDPFINGLPSSLE